MTDRPETGRIVCFGEVLLRLSPPGRELPFQSPAWQMWVGGAEANVATALACLGHDAALVSAVPDDPLGAGAVATLRGHGVDVRHVARGPGRMGLYFVVTGAGTRATSVHYDRAGSAFAAAATDSWDWSAILDGADRLHLSGITPALGPNGTRLALAAAEAARARAVPVSFDGNYRTRLWDAWAGEPHVTLRRLIGMADILFGDHRDIALVLGEAAAGGAASAEAAAFAAFPNLRLIASTRRVAVDVDRHDLSAHIATRDDAVETPPLAIAGIVDRIGGGDAFAAGVLHALRRGDGLAAVARTGLMLSALKHSLPGDASLFGAQALEEAMAGGFDVRR